MKDILVTICALLCVGAFFMMIGTAGAVDQDLIGISEGVGKLIKYAVVFIVTAIVVIKTSNEEDERSINGIKYR